MLYIYHEFKIAPQKIACVRLVCNTNLTLLAEIFVYDFISCSYGDTFKGAYSNRIHVAAIFNSCEEGKALELKLKNCTSYE